MGVRVYAIVADVLGRLAALLGPPEEAWAHLEHARAEYERVGAPLLLADVDAALAGVDAPPPRGQIEPEAAGWRRSGAVWHLTFRGQSTVVKDTKGVRDLAVLPTARAGTCTSSTSPNHDLARVDRLCREQEFLAAELAAALGLGGRTRRSCDPQSVPARP